MELLYFGKVQLGRPLWQVPFIKDMLHHYLVEGMGIVFEIGLNYVHLHSKGSWCHRHLAMAQGIFPTQAFLPLFRHVILTLQCRSPISEHLEYFKSKFSYVWLLPSRSVWAIASRPLWASSEMETMYLQNLFFSKMNNPNSFTNFSLEKAPTVPGLLGLQGPQSWARSGSASATLAVFLGHSTVLALQDSPCT